MITVHGRLIYETVEEILNPRHTAILVVDMQNDLVSPDGWAGAKGDVSPKLTILEPLQRTIEAGREAGAKIVYILYTQDALRSAMAPAWIQSCYAFTPNGTIDPSVETVALDALFAGTWGWEVISELEPKPEDFIVEKTRRGAFWATNLDKVLRAHRIESVLVTGTATAGCVLDTAVGAQAYDYYTAVQTDGDAETNQERHKKGMAVLEDRYLSVTSEQLVNLWKKR